MSANKKVSNGVKVRELAGSRRVFEIEVPQEAIIEKYGEVYSEIQKAAEIPGFRVGKAPRYLIETHYKDKAKEEVQKRLIADHVIRAVKDSGLNTIGSPIISDVMFESEKPLTFKAEVNVKPDVKLKSYKGLKAKKQKVNVSTEEVDKVVEELQERNAQLKDVEGRSAKVGDWCLCDAEVVIEGKPAEKNEGVWFPLNSKSTKREFLDQLIGSSPGDTKVVKTTLPINYPRKEQAGKEAQFLVTVNQIKERILPHIDDEFAKDLGGFKSLLELRGHIREELTKIKEQDARFQMEDDLINQLIKSTNFEAPTLMVDSEMGRLLKDARARLLYMGYKKEDIESQEPKMSEKLREEATKKVKGFFILEKVAEMEGIKVTEEEVCKRIELLASRSKRSVEDENAKVEEV
ncbi:MAG: hypothetical protein AMJ78_10395 [Omnitrophica WOR_2 bacterium SM23_29]|nr:MAG: hypothetical protein AMJ78_10395 [Omnitrophica WOR_2 bacterium SM23_29]